MTANPEQFARELDELLAGGFTGQTGPALQAARALASLAIDAEAIPPASLRARWAARTVPARPQAMGKLKARPVLILLLALLLLLTLSGVAYAFSLGHLWGYVPGYGIMDQNATMLVLAQPVSQTRDGITISIDELIVTSEGLYTSITTQNIPYRVMLPMSDTTTPACQGFWQYRLPDGSALQFAQGAGGGTSDVLDSSDSSLANRRMKGFSKFSHPLDIHQVTDLSLDIPCVESEVIAGSLPENWQFHLHLTPAPASMLTLTALPIYEYATLPIPTVTKAMQATPMTTFTALSSLVPTETAAAYASNPLSISKMVDTSDSYILIGEIARPAIFSDPRSSPAGWTENQMEMLDVNGQRIYWYTPDDIYLATSDSPSIQRFALKLKKEEVKDRLPITLRYSEVQRKLVKMAPFELDFGSRPKTGDEWQINRTMDVSGHTVTLATLRLTAASNRQGPGGYELRYTSDARIGTYSVDFAGYPLSDGVGGGGGGSDSTPTPEPFKLDWWDFAKSLPKGKVAITITWIIDEDTQSWMTQWPPEGNH